MLTKVQNNKFINPIIFSILTIFGYLFLEWGITQILFFFYLQNLIRLPFFYLIFKKNYSNSEINFDSESSFVVFLIIFLVFSFFNMGIMYYTSYQFGKFFDPFLIEFTNLFSYYAFPIIAIIAFEYIKYKKKSQIKILEPISSMIFLKRNVIYLLIYIPFFIILGLIYQNMFFSNFAFLILFIIINFLVDTIYLQKNNIEIPI